MRNTGKNKLIALGAGLGMIIGAILDYTAFGLVMGAMIGLTIYSILAKR